MKKELGGFFGKKGKKTKREKILIKKNGRKKN